MGEINTILKEVMDNDISNVKNRIETINKKERGDNASFVPS